MNKYLLGVDIGGTNFNIGLVNKSVIVEESVSPVDIAATKDETLDKLLVSIDSIISKDVEGIGVGVPAIVNPQTGVVYDVQNIPAWKEIQLRKILEDRYNLPIFINNDANCFAYGEKIYGRGKDYQNFVGLTIGTGIGMGVVINNSLYNGVLCGAGEIGMVNYQDSIIENYASSFFFTNTYDKSAKELSEMATKGIPMALESFDEFGIHLGEAVKNILYMYAPEAIILGGSISKAYPFFEKSLEQSISSFAYQKQIENLKIETSDRPGLAILGAAALCFQDSTTN